VTPVAAEEDDDDDDDEVEEVEREETEEVNWADIALSRRGGLARTVGAGTATSL
jgi:hypothetical protein